MAASCDLCAYNEYDEEDEAYYCSVNMDEDDFARFLQMMKKPIVLNPVIVCFLLTHSKKMQQQFGEI